MRSSKRRSPEKMSATIGPESGDVNADSRDGQSLYPRRLGISSVDLAVGEKGIAAQQSGLQQERCNSGPKASKLPKCIHHFSPVSFCQVVS
jgi:hypothetical protein